MQGPPHHAATVSFYRVKIPTLAVPLQPKGDGHPGSLSKNHPRRVALADVVLVEREEHEGLDIREARRKNETLKAIADDQGEISALQLMAFDQALPFECLSA